MKKIILIAILCTGLSGCGIKPKEVDPPNAERGQNFPQTYPDARTDPAYPARIRTHP